MLASIENEFLKLSVKGSGAEIVSLKGVQDNLEYIWQGDPQFWPRRAPILFPIVGKLKENKYLAEGKEFKLPQHGFARNQMFELASGTKDSLVFTLTSNQETLEEYPYRFDLSIGYFLKGKKVEVEYEVKNIDTKNILFSIGAHPGFNTSLYKDESFSDYYLEFQKNEVVSRQLLDEGLFNGKTEPVLNDSKKINLDYRLFEKDALVFKGLKSSYVDLKSNKSAYHIRFDFSGFPYLGIWTPAGKAPFVCIEPWFGLADKKDFSGNFNEKEGILTLKPGEKFTCKFSFEVVSC